MLFRTRLRVNCSTTPGTIAWAPILGPINITAHPVLFPRGGDASTGGGCNRKKRRARPMAFFALPLPLL